MFEGIRNIEDMVSFEIGVVNGHPKTNEDVVESIMNSMEQDAQHRFAWLSGAETDRVSEELRVEMMRLYLEMFDRSIFGDAAKVTTEEAQEFIDKIEEARAFERMMLDFVEEVRTRTPSIWTITMSNKHLDFVRYLHQKNQKLKMYRGKDVRTLYGVKIQIDNTLEEPRLD